MLEFTDYRFLLLPFNQRVDFEGLGGLVQLQQGRRPMKKNGPFTGGQQQSHRGSPPSPEFEVTSA